MDCLIRPDSVFAMVVEFRVVITPERNLRHVWTWMSSRNPALK